jgi:hypothetical protein
MNIDLIIAIVTTYTALAFGVWGVGWLLIHLTIDLYHYIKER